MSRDEIAVCVSHVSRKFWDKIGPNIVIYPPSKNHGSGKWPLERSGKTCFLYMLSTSMILLCSAKPDAETIRNPYNIAVWRPKLQVGGLDGPPSKLVELGAIYQLVTSCQDIQQYLYMVSLLRVVMGCSTWSPTARTLPPGRSTSQSPDDP